MELLSGQISTCVCPRHKLPYCSIYKGDLASNELRMLCDDCINPWMSVEQVIDIQKVFKFLTKQQVDQVDAYYQSKAILWQTLQHNKDAIMKILEILETLMDNMFKQITENDVIKTLQNEFIGNMYTQANIDRLGQYISSVIDQDCQGHYHYNQEALLSKQIGLAQLNKLLQGQKYVIDQWNSQLIEITNQVKMSQLQQFPNNACYAYKTTQSLKLDFLSQQVCLNHNETQLIAAGSNTLVIFDRQQQGQWVQQQSPQVGHNDTIKQVKFNHNSTLIASCGQSTMIIIWNNQSDGTWKIQDKLNSHKDVVNTVCFNHDSKLLASGSKDKTIKIHVLNNGKWKFQQSLTGHTLTVLDVCFNDDSTMLASGSGDCSIILWTFYQQSVWTVYKILNDHQESISSVSFSADSKQLISSSEDNTIKIWSVDLSEQWRCNYTLTEHTDTISRAQLNTQSNMIVSSSYDKSIKIWKINNKQEWNCTQTIDSHSWYINYVIFNRDSTQIISCSDDSSIMIHQLTLI